MLTHVNTASVIFFQSELKNQNWKKLQRKQLSLISKSFFETFSIFLVLRLFNWKLCCCLAFRKLWISCFLTFMCAVNNAKLTFIFLRISLRLEKSNKMTLTIVEESNFKEKYFPELNLGCRERKQIGNQIRIYFSVKRRNSIF
jgi:hypothetical protein